MKRVPVAYPAAGGESANAVSATLGGIPLDVVDGFEWPLYRGVDARPVIVQFVISKLDALTALRFGPHDLVVKCPKAAGIKPEMQEVTIKKVYIDNLEMPTDQLIQVRLYDRRVFLRETVWGRDYNVRLKSNTYRDGKQWTVGEVLTSELARAGVLLNTSTIDAAGLALPAPDNMALAGRLKVADGLKELLARTTYDLAVSLDGEVHLVDASPKDPLDLDKYGWKSEPPSAADIAINNSVPENIEVYFDQLAEFTATGADPAATRTGASVNLTQRYDLLGEIMSESDLKGAVFAEMTSRATLAGTFPDPRRLAPFNIDEYALNPTWEGTALQTTPYPASVDPNTGAETYTDAEKEAAKFARVVVATIQRDYRTLWFLSMIRGVDDYRSIEFALLDDVGAVVQSDERNGEVVGAVNGQYVVLYKFPLDRNSLASGDGSPFYEQRSGAIPMTASWERDPSERIVRLKAERDTVLPGFLRDFHGIRPTPVATRSLLQSKGAPNKELAQFLEWRYGRFRTDLLPTIYMVGKVNTSPTTDRYYAHTVKTNLGNAEPGVTIQIPAQTGIVAALRNGAIMNPLVVARAARDAAAPVIASYQRTRTGHGIALGVAIAEDARLPRNNIAEMAIRFWVDGPFVLTTRISLADAKLSERFIAAARKSAARNVDKAIVEKVQG